MYSEDGWYVILLAIGLYIQTDEVSLYVATKSLNSYSRCTNNKSLRGFFQSLIFNHNSVNSESVLKYTSIFASLRCTYT